MEFRRARRVLDEAIAARAFPAAVAEVGDATTPLWSAPVGRLTYDAGAAPVAHDTIFDLASLTKVLSTTPLIMQLVERGAVDLDDPVARHFESWTRADRAGVTLRDLLSHASGLPGGWVKLFLTHRDPLDFERAIAGIELEYEPRTRSVYSDLGFMLLGFLLDREVPLPTRLATLLGQMAIVDPLQFNPPALWRHRTAPTDHNEWRGRLLVGEVQDENTAALGGIAGHSGLFGTAAAVGAHARHLLQVLDGRTGAFRRDTLQEFIRRQDNAPGSSRALGWDTMLPTSSCGTRMSSRAFGHTGFTGTSLWVDPDRGVYVVLLSNRVHPTRETPAFTPVRAAFHDAVMEDLGR